MFWESKGWGRTLGLLVMGLGEAMRSIPGLEPFAPVVVLVGGLLGGAGITNAVLAKK